MTAIADITTMGVISIFVCLHKFYKNQDTKNKKVLAYLSILGIWIISFITITPDILEGRFKYAGVLLLSFKSICRWTNEVYGCDVKYEKGEKPKTSSYTLIVIINMMVMLLCYSIVLWKVQTTKDEEGHHLKRPISHTSMVFVLSLTYAFCILPVVFLSWNQVC